LVAIGVSGIVIACRLEGSEHEPTLVPGVVSRRQWRVEARSVV